VDSAETGADAVVITRCGRRIVTSRMMPQPMSRVTLRVDPDPGGDGAAWVSLTTTEAVQLADALYAQVRAIEGRGSN
jgi:hypothetical protein